MGLSITTAPASEPVTLAEVTAALRITSHDEDSHIESFIIPTARQIAETYTERAFMTQTLKLKLRAFGRGPIVLPRPLLKTLTSVQYVDGAGDTQTWAASKYNTVAPSGASGLHGSIEPAYAEVYPTTRAQADAITITYDAGYGAASAVPAGIKQAIFVLCEDLYSQRASRVMNSTVAVEAMQSAEALLAPFAAWRRDLRFD